MTKLKKIVVFSLCSFFIAGCSSDEETSNNGKKSDVGGDVAKDIALDKNNASDAAVDIRTDTGQNLVGGCSAANLDSCGYTPPTVYEIGAKIERTVSYTDISGAQRNVNIEIRRPIGAPEPSPVIVWSHGGGDGKTDPTKVGVDWGEVFNRAGFITIALAHEARGAAETRELCIAMNVGGCDLVSCNIGDVCTRGTGPDLETAACAPDRALGEAYCKYLRGLHWDRPHDLREVLDWVEAEAVGGMLDGVVDTSRIAYAGHSAGAGSTMMVAGAARNFRVTAPDFVLLDKRPIAFMSCSPQGPDVAGFTESSFTKAGCEALAEPADKAACFTRPHLTLTGVGDGTGPLDMGRRVTFELAPTGERYLAFIKELAAPHTTFDYKNDACERYARENMLGAEYPARCNSYRLWLRSAALAFFDSTLRDDADAKTYLESDNMAVLSGAAVEWIAK